MVKRKGGGEIPQVSSKLPGKVEIRASATLQLFTTATETETGIADLDYSAAHLCSCVGLQSFARLTALQETQKPV